MRTAFVEVGLVLAVFLATVLGPTIAESAPSVAQLPEATKAVAKPNIENPFLSERLSRCDLTWAKPVVAMMEFGDAEVLTQAVYPNPPGSLAAKTALKQVEFAIFKPGGPGGWHVANRLPLFVESGEPLPPIRVMSIGDDLLFVPRLATGIPSNSDIVYRNGGYQSYESLTQALLSSFRFLTSSKNGKDVLVVDGLGSTIAQYQCGEVPESNAVEVTTRYTKDGFRSIWGVKTKGDSPATEWGKLWVLTGYEKDGVKQANVQRVADWKPPLDDKESKVTYLSPDSDGTASTAGIYVWRKTTFQSGAEKAHVYELCRWSNNQITTRDCYLTVEGEGGIQRCDWDSMGGRWKSIRTPDLRWMTASPSVCISGKQLVVCRADGKIYYRPVGL